MGREQERLCERLVGLTDAQLQSASNLPGWSVADLLVHTTRVYDSLLGQDGPFDDDLAIHQATTSRTERGW
jgi:hypothetical protein